MTEKLAFVNHFTAIVGFLIRESPMRFSLLTFMLIVLAACSSAGSSYRHVNPMRVEVEGSVFDVCISEDHARAIRLNFALLPKLESIVTGAVWAIEKASGYSVVSGSVSGDQAVSDARVSCSVQA